MQLSTQPILQVERLVCLRNQRRLFSNLGFVLQAGQVLQIEGPNGCGKTSLLRILCLLGIADEGHILWNGKPVDRNRSEYLADIAYVAHSNGIKHELTVEENLRFSGVLAGVQSGEKREEALNCVGLADHRHALGGRLSAGQRRRVALARLLLTKASLWILDEPLTALDNHSVRTIEALLRHHVSSGGLLILTTHRPVDLGDCRVNYLTMSESLA